METNDVVRTLAQIARAIDTQQAEIVRLDEAAVRARARFEVAYAHAFLTSEGAMDARKQQAVLATATEKLDAEIADQQFRAARGRIQVLRDRLEVGRSLNAAVRADFLAQGAVQP